MSGAEPDPRSRGMLLQMLFGFFPAQVIHAAARLELADRLADGPRTTGELAAATGSHTPSLHRLLRAMACLGILDETGPGTSFRLGPLGHPLRSDSPDSVRSLAMLFCEEHVWRPWARLLHSVQTGETAFDQLYGMHCFDFFEQHPELSAVFNDAMAEGTRDAAARLVASYDFSRFDIVIDVGGGTGTLIARILDAAPALTGVLFDRSSGLTGAGDLLAAAGVADRCRVVEGDFFESVPEGGDLYLLKSVIHDWDDDSCTTILRHCREAMRSTGRLLIIEPVMPAKAERSPDVLGMVMSDLNMLVNAGGRERTEAEFEALFRAAGFELSSTARLAPTTYSLIEAMAI